MERQLKGIALILFGILLCMGGGELNEYFTSDISDIPFALCGWLWGLPGWFWCFAKSAEGWKDLQIGGLECILQAKGLFRRPRM